MSLRLDEELISLWVVEGNECALSFASQVLDLVWVLLGQLLEAGIYVVSNHRGILNQVQSLNLVDDGTEQDSPSWVSHPGVDLSVWFFWAQGRVPVVVACGLCFLRKCDHVW